MSRMSELLETSRRFARSTDPVTSYEAAERVIPHLSEIQERVLIFLKNCPAGATDYEISQYFEDDRSTYRSRRAELVGLGRVRDSGRKKVQDGSKRVVWEYVW